MKKLLGITIDSDLSFEKHVKNLCNKVSKRLNAMSHVGSCMPVEKRKMITIGFIESQFSYCPLIWMFHSRTLNNRINQLHETALHITFSDYKSTFNDVLMNIGSVTIHERNIQTLGVETSTFLNGMSSATMNKILKLDTGIP